MERLDLNYYYGKEAEQFTFYRLPKALITDPRFKDVTNNAKMLYGLMLDRMSLSAKSGWYDDENRVYIKYAIKSIMEDLNVGKECAANMLKELESIGLIELVKRSGMSTIIYVKNFISGDKAVGITDQSEKQTSPENRPVRKTDQSEYQTSPEFEPVGEADQPKIKTTLYMEPVGKTDQFENQPTTSPKNSVVPGGKSAPINIKDNNNEFSNNNLIYPSADEDLKDEMDKINEEALAYMEIIRENIEYDAMMSSAEWGDREMYDELYEIICDVVCVPKKFVRIGGENYPYSLVKSKFLKLTSSHLQYVIGCVRNNTTKVSNIRAYLITALYNAPNTMGHYYTAAVNHDMYGVG